MKKLLLFASAALLLTSSLYAKKWDFTKWSSETTANIVADEKWTGDEKGNGTVFEGAYWYAATLADGCSADSSLLANGVEIKELLGLKINALGNKQVAIATDYQVTKDSNTWGPYHGPQYLWFAGAMEIRIPGVKPGTAISAGVESHKPGDARGIDMYVNGNKVAWISGQAGYPDAYDEYTWEVPSDIDAETVDVVFKRSNGCHVYFFDVEGYGDDEFNADEVKVAYLYDKSYNTTTTGYGYGTNGGLDEDPIYNNPVQSYTATAIDLSAEQTLSTAELNDSLTKFDVVILSEAVSSGNNYAKALKDIINYVPMLNLKAYMYKNWGFGAGANPSPKATTIKVGEDYLDSELFTDVEIDEEGNLVLFDCEDVSTVAGGNLVQGYTVTAGTLFADDEVIATVSGSNAIHTHGTKNQYMLIPISSDNLNLLAEPTFQLVYNAIAVLAKTKSKVQNAAAPIVTQTKADKQTTVSIASTTAGATIYYTVDGTEPTEASPVYSEPFVVTVDGTVVKAFAVAHGYNNSDVTTAIISVQSQAAAPVISMSYGEGFSTLTLSQADNAVIYYSFSGIANPVQAATYSEPIVVTEPGTIYAFSAPSDALASEMASLEFTVAGIPAVKDTVAHFTANQTDWFDNAVLHVGEESALVSEAIANGNQFGATGNAKAIYYFGKSAWSYYDYSKDETQVVLGEDGNPLKSVVDAEQDSVITVHYADENALKYITSNTDSQWVIKSYGQVITGETSEGPVQGIGNGTAGRYANDAIDEIGSMPSKGFLDFGGKGSGEPYSESVESTAAFAAGEYDIVVYLGNGSTGNPIIALETSADGQNWTAVMDTLTYTNNQRYYKKTRKHVTFTEPQYVRVAQKAGSTKGYIYDIYVITTDGTTGIQAVENNDVKVADDRIFDLQGRRVSVMVPGNIYLKNGKKVIVR